jgi:hypothetical protein
MWFDFGLRPALTMTIDNLSLVARYIQEFQNFEGCIFAGF